jgi:hypothetical protein
MQLVIKYIAFDIMSSLFRTNHFECIAFDFNQEILYFFLIKMK